MTSPTLGGGERLVAKVHSLKLGILVKVLLMFRVVQFSFFLDFEFSGADIRLMPHKLVFVNGF
jgi:hypothetical protein